MARRGDTPPYIAEQQMAAIQLLAKKQDLEELRSFIPELVDFFKVHHQKITTGEVPLEKLVIAQSLSRDIEDFKVGSAASAAAKQLQKQGRTIRAGQTVEFLRTKDGQSLSWHVVSEERKPDLDIVWYCEQLLRAAHEILSPFGVPKELLSLWLNDHGAYWSPEDFVRRTPSRYPLFEP